MNFDLSWGFIHLFLQETCPYEEISRTPPYFHGKKPWEKPLNRWPQKNNPLRYKIGTSWGFYQTSKFEIEWEYIYSGDVAHDHLVKSGGWF